MSCIHLDQIRLEVPLRHLSPQFRERLLLNLPNAFPGQPETLSDALKGPLSVPVEPEPHDQDLPLPLRKLRQQGLDEGSAFSLRDELGRSRRG